MQIYSKPNKQKDTQEIDPEILKLIYDEIKKPTPKRSKKEESE